MLQTPVWIMVAAMAFALLTYVLSRFLRCRRVLPTVSELPPLKAQVVPSRLAINLLQDCPDFDRALSESDYLANGFQSSFRKESIRLGVSLPDVSSSALQIATLTSDSVLVRYLRDGPWMGADFANRVNEAGRVTDIGRVDFTGQDIAKAAELAALTVALAHMISGMQLAATTARIEDKVDLAAELHDCGLTSEMARHYRRLYDALKIKDQRGIDEARMEIVAVCDKAARETKVMIRSAVPLRDLLPSLLRWLPTRKSLVPSRRKLMVRIASRLRLIAFGAQIEAAAMAGLEPSNECHRWIPDVASLLAEHRLLESLERDLDSYDQSAPEWLRALSEPMETLHIALVDASHRDEQFTPALIPRKP